MIALKCNPLTLFLGKFLHCGGFMKNAINKFVEMVKHIAHTTLYD
jgi:hypothetical protein